MRSTNAGIPPIVVATSVSSSYAGTTTATVLPSSIRPERKPGGAGLRGGGLMGRAHAQQARAARKFHRGAAYIPMSESASSRSSTTRERLPQERGDQADDEPEESGDDDGVAPAP